MNMLHTIGTGAQDRRSNRDRRRAKRLDASGATVSVAKGGDTKAALCGDVSRGGARLSLDRPMVVGEIVTINFGPDVALKGRVTWVDQAECGIEFEQDVHGVVDGVPATRDRRQSQTPAGQPRFREGLNVTVVMDDCERKAILRWTQDNTANLTMQF